MTIERQLGQKEIKRYSELAHCESRRTLRNPRLAGEVGDAACFELVLRYAKNNAPEHPAAWIRKLVQHLRCRILRRPRAREIEFCECTAAEFRRPHEIRNHVSANEWARRRESLCAIEPKLLAQLTDQQTQIYQRMLKNISVRCIANELRIGAKDVRDVRRVIISKALALLPETVRSPSPRTTT